MNFDVSGIFVINLDYRTERWSLFAKDSPLWKNTFGVTPVRFSAVVGLNLPGYDEKPWFRGRLSDLRKKSWGGKAGCILSHRDVIQKACDQNLSNILIVEDDAIITDEFVKNWSCELNGLLANLPDDWSVINFCTTIPVSPCRVVDECHGGKLVECGGAFGAVAYLLNGRVIKDILRDLPTEANIWDWVARHKTIDRWFSQNLIRFGRVYLFAPAIVGHRTGESDISMTSENAGLLDFTLKDIQYIESNLLFSALRSIRKCRNALNRIFSFFRLMTKRFRGL